MLKGSKYKMKATGRVETGGGCGEKERKSDK